MHANFVDGLSLALPHRRAILSFFSLNCLLHWFAWSTTSEILSKLKMQCDQRPWPGECGG